MVCNRCSSENKRGFGGEVAIHFPGVEGLEKPIVWTFPQLLICLNCGHAQFTVPPPELTVLATGAPVHGVLASIRREETA